MNDIAKRVARRFLADAGAGGIPTEKTVTPARLLDLAVFALAYDAYARWLEEQGKDADALAQKGDLLLKRFKDDLTVAVQQHLVPLSERTDAAPIKPILRKAQMPGAPVTVVRRQAEMFQEVMPWLRTRTGAFNGIFTGRAAKAAREVATIAGEESPASLLNKAATVAPVSGLTLLRKWVEQAAAAAGAPVSATESVLVDAQIAKALGEELRDVEGRITSVDSSTPEAADLQAQRSQILDRLQKVADGSSDKSTVLATAASARKTDQYATETGRRLGHTPDQEESMIVRGRGIIAAGAGSGKCIVGDTLVQTEQGFIPIGEIGSDLEEGNDRPFVTQVHGRDRVETTSHAYYDGVHRTFRVETRFGYEIEGTGPHRVMTLSEGNLTWKTLQDLQLGDVLCLDRRPGLFAKEPFVREPTAPDLFRTNALPHTDVPLKMSPQVASLLGYIISEGYIRRDSWGISLSTTDPEQADLYRAALSGMIQYQEHRDLRQTPQFVLEFYRAADVRALMGFGMTRTKAQEKEIPEGILRSPRPIVTAFLRALFDGDGGVCSNVVEYATASTRLAEQLHVLLLAYGIPARRRFRPNNCSGAWHITISGLGLRTFASEIGFNLKAKQEKLEAIAVRKANTNVDIIPGLSGVLHIIKEQYRSMTGETKTKDPAYGTISDIVRGSREPSYKTLARALDFYKTESSEWSSLKTLCEAGWFMDPVVGITEDEAPVFDLVVPETHSFSAGGFINHNTRVLASKVVYHISELGIEPGAIMATTFTNKAAAELLSRVRDYGAVVEGPSADGFGTTHSIAGKMLNRQATAFRRADYIGKKEGWKQATLIRLAMEQVKMGGGAYLRPPDPKGLWESAFVPDKPADAVRAPYSKLGKAFFAQMEEQASGPWTKWLVENPGKIYSRGDWQEVLAHFIENLKAVADMKGDPSEVLNDILELQGLDGETMRDSLIRTVEEDDELMAQLLAEAEGGRVSGDQIEEQAMAPVRPLIGLVQGKADLGSAMSYVRRLKRVNEKIASEDSEKEVDRDAVTIGTMHSWKGLEVPTMYIPMVGGKFPRSGESGVAPESPDLWSERRLAYVAITRAMERCVILDIPSPKFGTHSQFIDEACIPESDEPATAGKVPKVGSWDPGTLARMEQQMFDLGLEE